MLGRLEGERTPLEDNLIVPGYFFTERAVLKTQKQGTLCQGWGIRGSQLLGGQGRRRKWLYRRQRQRIQCKAQQEA